MNNILAVVVTYNRLDMLKGTVSHLLSQSHPCDILLVDNASTDETAPWAKSQIEANHSTAHKLIYENTGANLGGAGGFQYGMKRAVQLGYDYVWVMDDDAMAEPDCLKELMKAAERIGNFGFLASCVLWTDGSLCKMNWQRKLQLPKDRSKRHLCEEDLSKDLIQIQSSTFVSALFPTKVIRKVGLPIKEFFIWCDDIEFTRRIALKHHLPSYVVTSSRIVHYINNNEGTNLAMDSIERIPRYNYAFRNENYMYRQDGIRGFCYYLMVIGYNTLRVLLNARSKKLARLKVMYKNLFTGLFFNPEIEFTDDAEKVLNNSSKS